MVEKWSYDLDRGVDCTCISMPVKSIVAASLSFGDSTFLKYYRHGPKNDVSLLTCWTIVIMVLIVCWGFLACDKAEALIVERQAMELCSTSWRNQICDTMANVCTRSCEHENLVLCAKNWLPLAGFTRKAWDAPQRSAPVSGIWIVELYNNFTYWNIYF